MSLDLPPAPSHRPDELLSKHAGEHDTVGRSVRRRDLVEKVLGTAQYAVDMTMPGMLHAKVVRADRAHAQILDIAPMRRSHCLTWSRSLPQRT